MLCFFHIRVHGKPPFQVLINHPKLPKRPDSENQFTYNLSSDTQPMALFVNRLKYFDGHPKQNSPIRDLIRKFYITLSKCFFFQISFFQRFPVSLTCPFRLYRSILPATDNPLHQILLCNKRQSHRRDHASHFVRGYNISVYQRRRHGRTINSQDRQKQTRQQNDGRCYNNKRGDCAPKRLDNRCCCFTRLVLPLIAGPVGGGILGLYFIARHPLALNALRVEINSFFSSW